jgi:hypothetical protein
MPPSYLFHAIEHKRFPVVIAVGSDAKINLFGALVGQKSLRHSEDRVRRSQLQAAPNRRCNISTTNETGSHFQKKKIKNIQPLFATALFDSGKI